MLGQSSHSSRVSPFTRAVPGPAVQPRAANPVMPSLAPPRGILPPAPAHLLPTGRRGEDAAAGGFSTQHQLPSTLSAGKQPPAWLLPTLGTGRDAAESLGWYLHPDSCSGARAVLLPNLTPPDSFTWVDGSGAALDPAHGGPIPPPAPLRASGSHKTGKSTTLDKPFGFMQTWHWEAQRPKN